MKFSFARLRRILISAAVCVSLAVPAAYFGRPHLERWVRLGELDSTDLRVREHALNYVIRVAPTDARVVQGAAGRLVEVDDQTALQILHALIHAGVADQPPVIDALASRLARGEDVPAVTLFRVIADAGFADRAPIREAMYGRMQGSDDAIFRFYVGEMDGQGVWGWPAVPIDLWMRSIELLLDDAEPMARVLGVHRLADLHLMACDPTVLKLLERAATDGDAQVRYAAILAAAELAGTPAAQMQRMELESILALGTKDDDPAIARDAWLILALLDPWSGFTADWRSAEPEVAEAILYAALKTNPTQPQPALDALHDANQPTRVRAAAAYALHLADNPPIPEDARDALVRWRLMLSAPVDALPKDLGLLSAEPNVSPVELPPIRQAQTFRIAPTDARFAQRAFDERISTLEQLAILEGALIDQAAIAIPPDAPDMHRLAAVAVTRDPRPDDLYQLFRHDEATMRDLACIVAAQRFTAVQNEQLIAALLRDFNDDAKVSGAILAGITGLKLDMLAERAAVEDVWQVRQMMQLGLWMQGRGDRQGDYASNLMTRDDLPHSTILLAILHRDRAAALDHLFNPRGEPPIDLIELLDHYRWNRVLRYYLTDDAPPLWHWADPDLKAFQIDVLRNWWLVTRGGFTSTPELSAR